MAEKTTTTKAAAKAEKAAAEAHEKAMAPKERDPLNQAVKEHSEEVAMQQDEIRRTRHGGPLSKRREELAAKQPDLTPPVKAARDTGGKQ